MAEWKKLPSGEVQYDLENVTATIDKRFFEEEPTTIHDKNSGYNLFCSVPWADILFKFGNLYFDGKGADERYWAFTGEAFNEWFEDSTPMQVAQAVLGGESLKYGPSVGGTVHVGSVPFNPEDPWFGFDGKGRLLSFHDYRSLCLWLCDKIPQAPFLEWFDENYGKTPDLLFVDDGDNDNDDEEEKDHED